jgi:hypothetical protein
VCRCQESSKSESKWRHTSNRKFKFLYATMTMKLSVWMNQQGKGIRIRRNWPWIASWGSPKLRTFMMHVPEKCFLWVTIHVRYDRVTSSHKFIHNFTIHLWVLLVAIKTPQRDIVFLELWM